MYSRKNDTFLLPEIIRKISKFLNRIELFNCLLVNKTWYINFLPIIWRNITISSKSTKLLPEYLEAHRQYVTNLTIHYRDPVKYSFHFPNLRTLALWQSCGPTDIKRDSSPQKILELNTTIVNLDIRGATLADWNCVIAYPNLDKLTTFYDINDINGINIFWSIFSKLSVLNFLRIPFLVKLDSSTGSIALPQVHGPTSDDRKCLSFAEYIKLSDTNLAPESLNSSMITNYLPSTDSNNLSTLRNFTVISNVENMNLLVTIKDMNKIKSLRCRGSSLGPMTFQALRPHLNNIAEITLSGDGDCHIQEILSSAPHLQKYTGGVVTAQEIAYGKPWVCVLLSELTMRIKFERREDHLQPLVFKQLSQLVHLKSLDITNLGLWFADYHEIESNKLNLYLKFSLDCGMDQLSNLKMLECIDAEWTNQCITDKDAEWMEKNLVSLKNFYGSSYTSSPNRIKFYGDSQF